MPTFPIAISDNLTHQTSKECIYGHRAPSCGHLNKVLVEVRAPGRPRVRCLHGKGYEGIDRCKTCFPAAAYVVPGHHRKLVHLLAPYSEHVSRVTEPGTRIGKCQCHQNPKEPIRDAMRAPQDVAEEHEDLRERAKEMRRLRATKGALPEETEAPSLKKGSGGAQSIKNEVATPQEVMPGSPQYGDTSLFFMFILPR